MSEIAMAVEHIAAQAQRAQQLSRTSVAEQSSASVEHMPATPSRPGRHIWN